MVGDQQDTPPASLAQPCDDGDVTFDQRPRAQRLQFVVVAELVDGVVVNHQTPVHGLRIRDHGLADRRQGDQRVGPDSAVLLPPGAPPHRRAQVQLDAALPQLPRFPHQRGVEFGFVDRQRQAHAQRGD